MEKVNSRQSINGFSASFYLQLVDSGFCLLSVTGIASRLSVENLAQLTEAQADVKPQSKLNDIMDFLENVEKESRLTEIDQVNPLEGYHHLFELQELN